MDCLKCPNYWKTDIDETQCDKCGTQESATQEQKETEAKDDAQMQ